MRYATGTTGDTRVNRHLARLCTASWLGLCAAALAGADCLTDQQVENLAAAYEARTPADNPVGLTPAEGECSRDKLTRLLQSRLGEPVGYKAGLTNEAVQQRFHHNAPVRGTLFAPMLLASGAVVDPKFGARPVFEADLLVRVSDAAVNRARTPLEVLQAIDQVIPFIELPDLVVADPGQLDGAGITAINVGARLGVMGNPLPVQRTTAFADALQNMVVVVQGDGIELDRGRGSDVLGHPLNAVTWMVADLARSGLALKPGDLVSLGSFSRLLQPQPGLSVKVAYLGLPGDPSVAVGFRGD